MSCKKKILLFSICPIVLISVLLGGLYVRSARQHALTQYIDKARAVVLSAEAMREEMAKKWADGVFTPELLRSWADEGKIDRVISTVPVVTAWRAAAMNASEGGYELRVPKFQPRNPKNTPDEVEARVLKMFEQKDTEEYYEVDRQKNAIRYFRPIRLTQECLLCHGDPKDSAKYWGNDKGLDPTGARMEGWKVGEVHGAFEVVQSLHEADAQANTLINTLIMRTLLIIAVTVGVVAWLVVWLTGRSIARPLAAESDRLRTSAQQFAEAAGQLSESSQHLATLSSQQAGSIQTVSTSVEEIAMKAQENTQNSRRVNELMESMDGRVKDSERVLRSMVDSMAALKDSSQRVSKIIKSIDEIAFQTNILALNAAVEAARAGEAGQGFAVVADEVRSLAQRVAQAARDTASLIEDSITKAQDVASQVEAVSAFINEITAGVGQVKTQIQLVAAATQEQCAGIEHVKTAVQEIEKATQSIAAMAEQTAATAEEVGSQANLNMASVANLQALVFGASDGPSAVGGTLASQERTAQVFGARGTDHRTSKGRNGALDERAEGDRMGANPAQKRGPLALVSDAQSR
jgi:methyl-accepting chemotaxis protein